MKVTRYADLDDLEGRMNLALDRRMDVDPETSAASDRPAERVVRAQLRWALWCVEGLRELRDLVDITDSRGLDETPQGFRPYPTSMAHLMWASVTAMGALDRAAAALGAVHLGTKENGQVHDLGQLIENRSRISSQHPAHAWLNSVRADDAFKHLINLLRHPMVHRTTPMALYGSAGGPSCWEDIPAHWNAPGFYLPDSRGRFDPEYTRSVTVVEFLDEVTPSVLTHVTAAISLVESGEAF